MYGAQGSLKRGLACLEIVEGVTPHGYVSEGIGEFCPEAEIGVGFRYHDN